MRKHQFGFPRPNEFKKKKKIFFVLVMLDFLFFSEKLKTC